MQKFRSKVFGLFDGHAYMIHPWNAVYALVDPRNGLRRYVGVTFDTIRRLRGHVTCSMAMRTPKDIWIRGLLAEGMIPSMEILEIVGVTDRIMKEAHWIQKLNAEGLLLNHPVELTRYEFHARPERAIVEIDAA